MSSKEQMNNHCFALRWYSVGDHSVFLGCSFGVGCCLGLSWFDSGVCFGLVWFGGGWGVGGDGVGAVMFLRFFLLKYF